MRYYKIIIYLTLAVSTLFAQAVIEADSLYENGNQAMLQENFESAIENYHLILDQGHSHPDLFYNLGNAYYRLDRFGAAVWAYEKGLQLTPRDKDLRFNLLIVNARVRDRIEMPKTILSLEQYRSLKKSATLSDIILIASAIFMLGAFVYFLKKYYQWRSIWISRIISAFFVLSIVVHLMALDKYFEISDTKNVIIVMPEVDIYSAPFARSETVLFRLHEGVKAEITQEQSGWVEIILIDGKKGWLESEKVWYL
ncbi:MAG: SH3 domain-containing protein [Candidatus Neomarinimicrobiota bacterium]